MTKSTKRNSDERWKQNNYLVDKISPQLKSSGYIAVLWACFRHGRGLGFFRVSTKRIAQSSLMGERYVRRILDDFEACGLIEVVKERQGTIPRTYRIRFEYDKDELVIKCNFPARSKASDKKAKAK